MQNLFEQTDKELQDIMSGSGTPNDIHYKMCLDVLVLRHHERLIDKTEALVRKTWWVACATWAVAGVTIIAILARR